MSNGNGVRIRRFSVATGMRRLVLQVSQYERRHGCSSEAMLEAVRDSKAYETPEVSKWLTSYQVLRKLEQQVGLMTGIPTRSTK